MAGPITTFDVKTQGVDHLIDRLKGFEPEVYKVLTREIKAASDKVGASARGFLPPDYVVSGWGPWGAGEKDYFGGHVAAKVRPGVRTRRVGGQRYVMGLVTMSSPGGVVYALLGRQDNSRLAETVKSIWGTEYPRALKPAWHLHADEAREDIQTAIDKAAEAVTRG